MTLEKTWQIQMEEVWNHSFDSMIMTDADGKILALNRTAARLLLGSPSTLVGASIYELIPSDDLRSSFQRKTLTGISISLGTKQLIGNISFYESGIYFLFMKDISQSQQLQQQIHKMNKIRQLFDIILDQIDEGICVIDEHGTVLFFNRKAGDVEVLEPETVRNKRVQDIWNIDENSSTLLTAFRTGRTLNHRETQFTSNGKAVTTLVRTVPLWLGEQRIAAMEVSKDITEQKQLTDSILQLQKQTKEASSKDHLTSQKNNTLFQFENINYSSREMAQVVEQARRSARSKSNILIVGETGTGKELFAQSIHNESPRKHAPFIAQNCAALPESLLESLLFGTAVGSFTGAVDRAGLFEQADGGTLLLDEINSMSIDLQAKLLRVLQERKVKRLGSSKVIDIDVRIIATINEDPHEAIKNERLREDLYYRLGVVNLVIPPLRNRKEDIRTLVEHFIEKHSKALDVSVNGVNPDIFDFFLHYHWPGNVRQLEHVIEGCLNLVYDEETIGYDHLPPILKNNMHQYEQPTFQEITLQFTESLPEQMERLERNMIEEAMKKADRNVTKAAEQLGISRQTLNYKLKKYFIYI